MPQYLEEIQNQTQKVPKKNLQKNQNIGSNTQQINLNLFQGFQRNENILDDNNDGVIENYLVPIPKLRKDLPKSCKTPQTADSLLELKKLFPYQLDQIIVQIAQADFDYESDDNSQGQKQIKRVKQSRCMFIIIILISLVTATENLYIFLGTLPFRDVIFTFPTLILRLIFIPIVTLKLCQNTTVNLRLLFMVDKIMLSGLMHYIGVLGFILIFLPYTPSAWFYNSLIGIFPVMWLFYLWNFRVSMIYCQWSKTEVIIYKITLIIGCTSYFILGVYYLIGKLRFTRGLRPQLDDSISNLLLIYINAGFQIFLQMIARMDTVDGSVNFKINYKLHCDPEDMEALLKGRKDRQMNNSDHSSSISSDSDQNSDSYQISNYHIERVQSEIESRRSRSEEQSQTNSYKNKNIKHFHNIRREKRYLNQNQNNVIDERVSESWESILNMESISRRSLKKPKKPHLFDEVDFSPQLQRNDKI